MRHLDVDPDPVQIGNLEQLLPGTAAGVDQRADIRIAQRDDTIEGRNDLLEGLHRLQLPHIRFVGIHDRLLRRCVGDTLVRSLLGHDLLLRKNRRSDSAVIAAIS